MDVCLCKEMLLRGEQMEWSFLADGVVGSGKGDLMIRRAKAYVRTGNWFFTLFLGFEIHQTGIQSSLWGCEGLRWPKIHRWDELFDQTAMTMRSTGKSIFLRLVNRIMCSPSDNDWRSTYLTSWFISICPHNDVKYLLSWWWFDIPGQRSETPTSGPRFLFERCDLDDISSRFSDSVFQSQQISAIHPIVTYRVFEFLFSTRLNIKWRLLQPMIRSKSAVIEIRWFYSIRESVFGRNSVTKIHESFTPVALKWKTQRP